MLTLRYVFNDGKTIDVKVQSTHLTIQEVNEWWEQGKSGLPLELAAIEILSHQP